MLKKIESFKYLFYNKKFIVITLLLFGISQIIVFEIKRRYSIDVVKGVNFPFDDLYFNLKSKIGF